MREAVSAQALSRVLPRALSAGLGARRRAGTYVDGVRDGDQGEAPADGVDGGARVVEELVPDVAEEEEVAVPETSSASLSVWSRSTRATAQERSLEAPPESEPRRKRRRT